MYLFHLPFYLQNQKQTVLVQVDTIYETKS